MTKETKNLFKTTSNPVTKPNEKEVTYKYLDGMTLGDAMNVKKVVKAIAEVNDTEIGLYCNTTYLAHGLHKDRNVLPKDNMDLRRVIAVLGAYALGNPEFRKAMNLDSK